MKESLCLVCAVCAGMFLTTASAAELRASLWTSFAHPPTAAKPWSYYFIQNTLTDNETVSEEVADIRRLGFGGASCGPIPERDSRFAIEPLKWSVRFRACTRKDRTQLPR